MDQAAIDAAFAQWLGQASVNGGCSPTLSNVLEWPLAHVRVVQLQ